MSGGLGSHIWERGKEGGADTLSERGYMAAINFFTLYGVGLAAIIAYLTMSWQINIVALLFVGLAIPIVGIVVASKSDNWFVSLVGYTMVVVGLGAITGPVVAMYKVEVVVRALLATAAVTATMSIIGIIFPRIALGWGGALFGILTALVMMRLVQVFVPIGSPTGRFLDNPIFDYVGVVLFSAYIIYDWNRAFELPKTLDNAVDVALAIFLDIINLFIELLKIMGRSSDDD